MRRGTSAYAIELPPLPSATLTVIQGRQRVVRHGLFFTVIGRHRRSAYMNLDGSLVMADECQCRVDWPEAGGAHGLTFEIVRRADCPIDEHKRLAIAEWENE